MQPIRIRSVLRTATPSQVAVDETAVKINGEWSWLSATIDIESKLILDVALFGRHGTDPAVAFLHRLHEKHDLSDAEFLVDQFGYRTSLRRLGLTSQVHYTDRNHVEKCFYTLKMRIDRFHDSWVAVGRASASGLNSSCITTTIKDRIKRSTETRQPRRFRTRQCHVIHYYVVLNDGNPNLFYLALSDDICNYEREDLYGL